MAEQVVVHVVAVGVGVGGEQADILVEVEGAAQGEVELLGLVQSDEVAIDPLHGLAGGQAQNEVRVGPEFAGDDASGQGGGGFVIRLYDDFHAPDSGKAAGRRPPNYSPWRQARSYAGTGSRSIKGLFPHEGPGAAKLPAIGAWGKGRGCPGRRLRRDLCVSRWPNAPRRPGRRPISRIVHHPPHLLEPPVGAVGPPAASAPQRCHSPPLKPQFQLTADHTSSPKQESKPHPSPPKPLTCPVTMKHASTGDSTSEGAAGEKTRSAGGCILILPPPSAAGPECARPRAQQHRIVSCCARGRAHFGGNIKMRPRRGSRRSAT